MRHCRSLLLSCRLADQPWLAGYDELDGVLDVMWPLPTATRRAAVSLIGGVSDLPTETRTSQIRPDLSRQIACIARASARVVRGKRDGRQSLCIALGGWSVKKPVRAPLEFKLRRLVEDHRVEDRQAEIVCADS